MTRVNDSCIYPCVYEQNVLYCTVEVTYGNIAQRTVRARRRSSVVDVGRYRAVVVSSVSVTFHAFIYGRSFHEWTYMLYVKM